MSTKNSSCEYFLPLLDALVDKELEASEQLEVEAHLGGCEDCSAVIKEIELLKSSLANMPKLTLGRDLADDLDKLLQGSASSGVVPKDNVVPLRKRNNLTVAFAAAAAVAVIFIAGRAITTAPSVQVADSTLPKAPPVVVVPQSKVATKYVPIQASKTSAAAHSPVVAQHNVVPVTSPVKGVPHLKVAPQQNNNLVATESSGIVKASENRINKSSSNEVIALYDDDDFAGTDVGMTTDEDGLYALQL
ncbi:MAG: zf-HC2 domain-containing protein [Leptolyngbya sp.]|nr:zf-HC2 domain-containing protein [Candidatus Melainabacteria bacterium]